MLSVNSRIILAVAITCWGAACQNGPTTITPEYRSLTEAVYASGVVRPADEYQVFAPVGGIVRDRLVNEGEGVNAGQVLFAIVDEMQDLQLASATQRLAAARRNASPQSAVLAELRLSVESAHQQYLNDSTHYQRYQRLREQNVSTPVALDQARLQYVASRHQYLAAQRMLAQRSDELQDQLTEARIAYEQAARARGDALVESRISGTVYNIGPEAGEMITANQPLARIGNDSSLSLRLAVDERDIARVAEGQLIRFTTDVLPDTVLAAHVSCIHPFLDQTDRSFTVEAKVAPVNLPLYPGSTVEANIIIRQKERALVVPKTVLASADSVWVVRDGERQRIKIDTGVDNMEAVEVVAGLDETSEVIVP